jgi:hypothetical protein
MGKRKNDLGQDRPIPDRSSTRWIFVAPAFSLVLLHFFNKVKNLLDFIDK